MTETSAAQNGDMTSQSARLAEFAGLLADRTRAEFCLALLDGRAWTASELAARAGVAASTATEQLHRLLAAGMITERKAGRHRYVQLAGPSTAELLESLTAALGPVESPARSLRAATASAALARGRTCYDHLAGRLGVMVTDAMAERGLLDVAGGFSLGEKGMTWLRDELDADVGALRRVRRPLVRECLDWTERRSHLAGAVGALLCTRLFDHGWVVRVGSGRAVRPTRAGETALRDLLGLDPALLTGSGPVA